MKIRDDNIEKIYEKIVNSLNEIEKENSHFLIYTKNGFIKYKECYNKNFLSLNIKIKENRIKKFINILDDLNIHYLIIYENTDYSILEIKKDYNYIVLDYVVDSHVTIPKSFLKNFGYKSTNGVVIDYIDINTMKIKTKKIKEYGVIYGYYSKHIERYLSDNFESKIALINKEIKEFRKENLDNIILSNERLEDIYNFFDITTYRNLEFLKGFNEESISSKLIGGYNHNDLLDIIANKHISKRNQHIYNGLKFNLMINKTNRNFVISDNMISSIKVDSGNEIIILPISTKECLVLMDSQYYQKYMVNGDLYYMRIDDEKKIGKINRSIFKKAKEKNENIIGEMEELEILLKGL